MNLKAIDRAIAAYEGEFDEADAARMAFFRTLWGIMQDESDRLAETNPYEPLEPAEFIAQYWKFTPALLSRPVAIDAREFAHTCTLVAAHMAENAGLENDVASVLDAYEWSGFANACDLEKAGRDPAAFVEECLKGIDRFCVDSACPGGVFMMVPTFALRAHLQGPAQQTMENFLVKRDEQNYHDKPLRCPICGTHAAAAYVLSGASTESHDRMLFCATCGTTWSFERVRCACCGMQNQAHLHWFHLEGDSAHRLQNCEECGDYMRTVFQDDLGKPLSIEVEDVIMARLDAVALSFTPSSSI